MQSLIQGSWKDSNLQKNASLELWSIAVLILKTLNVLDQPANTLFGGSFE